MESPFPSATVLHLCEEQVTTLQAKLAEREQMKSNKIVSSDKFMKTHWKALKRHKELGNAERNSIERTFSAVWIDLHPFIPLAFLRSDVSEGSIQVPASIRRQPFSQAGWRDLISHFWLRKRVVFLCSESCQLKDYIKQGPGPRRTVLTVSSLNSDGPDGKKLLHSEWRFVSHEGLSCLCWNVFLIHKHPSPLH